MEYNIDGVDIPFDIKWTSIAISLSGGADSALLAYMLANIAEAEDREIIIHTISHTRMWKTRPWQEWDSLKVFEWMQDRFPNIAWIRHTNFIAPDVEYGNMGPIITDEYGKKVSGDNAQIRAYSEYICHQYGVDSYYNGVTKNPDHIIGMAERKIEPTPDNQHLRMMKHMNGYAIHPFRFTTKDWVVKQYVNFGIMDLFNITRSCEGEFSTINYLTYAPNDPVPTCGECFWCKEREWAVRSVLQ